MPGMTSERRYDQFKCISRILYEYGERTTRWRDMIFFFFFEIFHFMHVVKQIDLKSVLKYTEVKKKKTILKLFITLFTLYICIYI